MPRRRKYPRTKYLVRAVHPSGLREGEVLGSYRSLPEAVDHCRGWHEQTQATVDQGYQPMGPAWLRIVREDFNPLFLHPYSYTALADFRWRIPPAWKSRPFDNWHRASCCGELYQGDCCSFYQEHLAHCPRRPLSSMSLEEETGETGAPCREPDPPGWS